MEVETNTIRGTYEELLDVADDLGHILSASATDLLDLTPTTEVWLVDQLERVELAITGPLDSGSDHPMTAPSPELRVCPEGGVA